MEIRWLAILKAIGGETQVSPPIAPHALLRLHEGKAKHAGLVSPFLLLEEGSFEGA